MKKYFEYKDEKSSKFWEIETTNKNLIVCYGKIGSQGQTQEKYFETNEEAEKNAQKLIQFKI